MDLNWTETADKGYVGKSGSITIAIVVCPGLNNPDKYWEWYITGVAKPYGWGLEGIASDVNTAKTSANSIWNEWKIAAGLQ